MADFSAASHEVDVRFLVQVGSRDFVPEPAPLVDPNAKLGYEDVRGAVEIVHGDLPPAVPEDELISLVPNLCFEAVATVLSQHHAVVAFGDTYGYLRLDLEGERIRLSGDRLPDVRLPRAALVESLVECGARYRAWLRACKLEGDIDSIDRRLGELESAARQAVTAAKRP